MMMLPPVGPGASTERRRRTRRATDRVAEPASREAGVEAPFGVDPAPEVEARPSRRGGRRASDRAPEPEASPSKVARAPRPYAPLVAQIIANVLGVEQTRTRLRASLAEAEALYAQKRERPKRSRGEA